MLRVQGDNAWLFIAEDYISESVKAYVNFESKLKEKIPREEREKARPIDVSGEQQGLAGGRAGHGASGGGVGTRAGQIAWGWQE